MRILVVVAHPDDEVLGMGGTILKHAKKGDKVRVVYLATGIASRVKYSVTKLQNNQNKLEKKIFILRKKAEKASKVLNVESIAFYDFLDNEMDSVPLLKIVKVIENEVDKFKPDIIYTNHYGDLNIDHKIVYKATLTACRPSYTKVKELICIEVPSSTEWSYPTQFIPNFFVNIENQLQKKIKAMKMYESELRKFPHPRSLESLKIIAMRWGSVSGNKSAEAFEIIRKIEK